MSQAELQKAFTEDIQRVHRQLFGYIFALLRNLEETQDVYQQTCLAMWQKYETFDRRSSFGTWACAFARHKVMDYRKTSARRRERFSEEFSEQLASLQISRPSGELSARSEALAGCLDKLPPQDRALVRALYGEGQSVREVAGELGRSAESVHGSWRRVRERLLECIDRSVAREEHP